MQTTTRFTLAAVAVVALASLTGCTADPAIASGAAFPGGRGPGIAYVTAPPEAARSTENIKVDRVRDAKMAEFRASDRPIARRPRSGCPSCD